MQGKSVLPEVLLGEMVRSIGRNGSWITFIGSHLLTPISQWDRINWEILLEYALLIKGGIMYGI